jgi:uncharacterized membrane protein YoaK (UPF0700 family)
MTPEDIRTLILLLLPILLIQLGLAVYALLDLRKRERTRGPHWAWAVGLIITALALPTGMIVSAIYLVWGRSVEDEHGNIGDPD